MRTVTEAAHALQGEERACPQGGMAAVSFLPGSQSEAPMPQQRSACKGPGY